MTHDMIASTGMFNLTVLSQDAPFKIFEHLRLPQRPRRGQIRRTHDLPRSGKRPDLSAQQQLRRAQLPP